LAPPFLVPSRFLYLSGRRNPFTLYFFLLGLPAEATPAPFLWPAVRSVCVLCRHREDRGETPFVCFFAFFSAMHPVSSPFSTLPMQTFLIVVSDRFHVCLLLFPGWPLQRNCRSSSRGLSLYSPSANVLEPFGSAFGPPSRYRPQSPPTPPISLSGHFPSTFCSPELSLPTRVFACRGMCSPQP